MNGWTTTELRKNIHSVFDQPAAAAYNSDSDEKTLYVEDQ